MAFGFRLPGIRVSTRGVSVGPRIASVHVGKRGPSISSGVGPVGASVGLRGAQVRSRIGPVSVSAGTGGVRVGGGIGPVGVSAGARGVSTSLAAGPFWLGTSSAITRRNNLSSSNQFRRVSLSDQYEEHRRQIKMAGVKRRNKADMAAAAVTAQIFEMSSMIAWAQPYDKVIAPKVPVLPSVEEIFQSIKKQKLQPNLSQNALADEAQEKYAELKKERELLLSECNSCYEQFLRLEPDMSLIVLQAILSDNGVPGAPVGVDDGDVLVLLSFPDSGSLIWPEIANKVSSKQLEATVQKRTKQNIADLYKLVLLRYLLATGKEVLAANDQIRSVRVIAVNGDHTGSLASQPIRGSITLDQSDLPKLTTDPQYLKLFDRLIDTWEEKKSDFYVEEIEELFEIASDLWFSLKKQESERFPEFIERLQASQSAETGELEDSGVLSDHYDISDFNSIDESGQPLNVEENIAITNYSIIDPYFWRDAKTLVNSWNQDLTGISSNPEEHQELAEELEMNASARPKTPDEAKSALTRLEELAELKETGALTDDEFQTLKSQILEQFF